MASSTKRHVGALRRAIARAEALLPGRSTATGIDERWQAILKVGDFIESHPDEVCAFALKWAKVRGVDLQRAIQCCLIEHLLEYHFDRLFPVFRREAFASARVARHFYPYSPFFKFGQANLPQNKARLRRLARALERKAEERRQKTKSSCPQNVRQGESATESCCGGVEIVWICGEG
jgi:hypothetical protein